MLGTPFSMKTLPLLSSAIFQQENEMTYSTVLLKIKTLIKKCYILVQKIYNKQNILPGGESNPGLPHDRRGYSPLYYRGICYLCSRLERGS